MSSGTICVYRRAVQTDSWADRRNTLFLFTVYSLVNAVNLTVVVEMEIHSLGCDFICFCKLN